MRRHPARLLGIGLLVGVLALLTPISALAAESAAASSGSSYASWYGAAFQGHVMANGQIYNMYNPTTTASNWFPFNTWVRVTNPANGKSVTVRVTDRGNFSWAFDLSYAAFATIASPSAGKIAIRYQVVSGPTTVTRTVAPAPVKTAPPTTQARAQVTSRGGTRTSVEARPLNPDYRTYLVHGGDTLTSIARLFGVDLGALISANNLADPSLIHPQQMLAIPEADKADLTIYGDTLQSVAKRNGTTMKAILALNELHGFGDLHPGERIELP